MKKLKGTVVSLKMNKTAVVSVERTIMHKVYKKRLTLNSKYLVDMNKKVNVGDVVEIVETKPISKKKRWKILSLGK